MTSLPRSVTVLLAACIASACDGGDGELRTGAVRDSAGIAIVEIAGDPRALDWRVEEIARVDPIADDRAEGFFEASSVAVTGDDRIVVVDRTAPRVALLAPDGRVRADHGRAGGGPGEFRLPLAAVGRPAGGVAVWDAGNRRLERFDADLEPTGPVRLRERPYGGRLARLGGDRLVMAISAESGGAPVWRLLAVEGALEGDPDSPREAVDLTSMPRATGGRIDLQSCGMGFTGLPPLFAPDLRWDARAGAGVVVARTDRWAIDVHGADDGALERRIRRAVEPTPATPERAAEEVGEGMRVRTPAGERVCEPDEVVEARGVAETVPVITRVAMAPSGDIWVERRIDGGETTAIDVVDAEGELRGTLPSGTPFPDAFLSDGRLVRIAEDDLGRRSVVVHAVRRGG